MSHQIRIAANRLLSTEISDVDGITESRQGTTSVFNGPSPAIETYADQESEIEGVATWLSARIASGVTPQEIGIFVRTNDEFQRAKNAIQAANVPYKVLDDKLELVAGFSSIATMHLAKGLEFRAVVVMACDDEIIPLQRRMEEVGDDADLEEVFNTERHLLYVACTRARDELLVSGVEPASEFLDDLGLTEEMV